MFFLRVRQRLRYVFAVGLEESLIATLASLEVARLASIVVILFGGATHQFSRSGNLHLLDHGLFRLLLHKIIL